MWKVQFYQTQSGEFPVRQFIREQDEAVHAKILRAIVLLQKGGPFLKPPEIKKLYRNLYELRVVGKTQIRIFYTVFRGEYYLLHAFKKKTQKTPSRELKTALDRLKKLI